MNELLQASAMVMPTTHTRARDEVVFAPTVDDINPALPGIRSIPYFPQFRVLIR